MNWTKEPPTITGFWWLRGHETLQPIIVYVDVFGDYFEVRFTGFEKEWTNDQVAGSQWAGPLLAPESKAMKGAP